jgi:hypothetical protein
MSYGIREGVQDAKETLEAQTAIAELYPDARLDALPNGQRVWVSASVKPDNFSLVNVHGEKAESFLCPYTTVKGLRVYTDHWKWEDAAIFIHWLENDNKQLHAALLTQLLKKR